jgi:hypothetical protein
MLRSFFFSTGLFITLCGAGFLYVDKITLNVQADTPRPTGFRGLFTGVSPERKRVFDPPDWAAFSLLSMGSVTMLYSIALPRKKHDD